MLFTARVKEPHMQRHCAKPWVWQPPDAPEVPYAALQTKAGQTYAGPADGIVPFAQELADGATMMICTRAEALRLAVRGYIEHPT